MALIRETIFNWAIMLTKKGDNNAKLIREKRFEISLQQQQAHHVCFRCAAESPRAVMKRYSFNPQLKLGENLTQMLHYSLWIFLKSCCGKVNDAHISLIETLQMLQIRQTDAVLDHLVQFWSLGTKSFQPKFTQKQEFILP